MNPVEQKIKAIKALKTALGSNGKVAIIGEYLSINFTTDSLANEPVMILKIEDIQ